MQALEAVKGYHILSSADMARDNLQESIHHLYCAKSINERIAELKTLEPDPVRSADQPTTEPALSDSDSGANPTDQTKKESR